MIVYELSKQSGFFSEFFFLCQAYLYAQTIGEPFFIHDEHWLYGRWHDYFTTLHTCVAPSHTYKYNEHTPIRFFSVEQYAKAVQDIFQLRAPLRLEAKRWLAKECIGLFVRRGDKLIREARFLPVKDILQTIDFDSNTEFFVQTDDYGVIEEMSTCIPNTIHSIVPKTKRGSYHNEWLKKTPKQIRQETEEMLTGLYVCLHSKACWTDHTSNIGRFLKLYGMDRVRLYTTDKEVNVQDLIHPSFSLWA